MLRVSSEIAVATSVRSVGPNPSAAASSRPFWRAKTTSASERTGIDVSPATSASAPSLGPGPSDGTARRRSRPTGLPFLADPLRLLVQEGEPFFQVERGVDVLQGEPPLHHRERHLRLKADDDRLGPAQPGHVRDV